MRIYISEYVSGGGWPSIDPPNSLVSEGLAMLTAVVRDFLRLPGCEVWTTWDARQGALPQPLAALSANGLHVELSKSPEHEGQIFVQLVAALDAALVIAPETDDVLASRCQRVQQSRNCRSLNAMPSAIQLCGDKRALYEFLVARDIVMPQQWLSPEVSVPATHQPRQKFVQKLRHGAGSQEMQLLTGENLVHSLPLNSVQHDWVYEQYIAGRPISVVGIFDDCGRLKHVFSPADQLLSDDGSFHYLGGQIPAAGVPHTEINRLISRVAEVVPGLRGYIGFDIVIPDAQPLSPVLIEINPRLTTSYVGYRLLTSDSLAAWLIPWQLPAATPQFSGRIQFTPYDCNAC